MNQINNPEALALEPVTMEDENGQSIEYKPVSDFLYKDKRYGVFTNTGKDDTIILELINHDGVWDPEIIDDSIEKEVLAHYSTLLKTAQAPDTPETPKLSMEEIKARLDQKYAIAEGLPAWDLLPPSMLITRTKRA